jgi:hypothetical protein
VTLSIVTPAEIAGACVTTPEKVRVQVKRRSGSGAFSVKATYAG